MSKAWGATLDLRPGEPGGPRLDVVGQAGRVLARIDTRTHRVVVKPRARRAAGAEDTGTSWLPLAAPTAALLILLAAAGRLALRRRRSEPITEVWEAELGPTRPDRLTIWPVEGDQFGIDVSRHDAFPAERSLSRVACAGPGRLKVPAGGGFLRFLSLLVV